MRKVIHSLRTRGEELYANLRVDPRTRLMLRDLQSIRTEKTVVLALLVQLFIAAFSSFLVVGVASIYETGAQETNIAVLGEESDLITTVEDPNDDVFFYEKNSREVAMEGLRDGRLDGVLVAEDAGGGRVKTTLYVMDGSLKTTVVINQMSRTLERLERHQRIQNADKIRYRILAYPQDAPENTYFTFAYTKLVPLLVFIPVFLSGSIVVDMVSEERDEGTFEVLRTTPLTLTDIITSKTAGATIFGVSQVALWLVLLTLNGIAVHYPFVILLVAAGLMLGAVSLGLGIVVAVPERRYAQFIYSGAVLAGIAGLGALPQHPANTIARLSIGGVAFETLFLSLAVFLGGFAVSLSVPRIAEPVYRYLAP